MRSTKPPAFLDRRELHGTSSLRPARFAPPSAPVNMLRHCEAFFAEAIPWFPQKIASRGNARNDKYSRKKMNADFLHTTLGDAGIKVHRLGLSASYRPGKKTVYKALDEGLNFFFCYGFDTQMIKVLREVMKGRRENYAIATGAYNLLFGHPNLRRTLEKRLHQLNTDYIDFFLFLGVTKPEHFDARIRDEYYRFR
jgi:hypothetical protein